MEVSCSVDVKIEDSCFTESFSLRNVDILITYRFFIFGED